MNRILLGQRLAFGFEGTCIPENFAALVREYKIGNVILFRRNIENNDQLRRLCRELQSLIIAETGHPAFITIDQEGGMVTRLAPDAVNVPGNMAIAATGRIGDAYTAASITARQLRGVGVNFNLAPVLDVNSNRRNPVIGVRSFGDDAARVAALAREAVRGYADAGVLCCGKHFPGHGDTAVDSHLGLPCIDKPLAELEETELLRLRRDRVRHPCHYEQPHPLSSDRERKCPRDDVSHDHARHTARAAWLQWSDALRLHGDGRDTQTLRHRARRSSAGCSRRITYTAALSAVSWRARQRSFLQRMTLFGAQPRWRMSRHKCG